MQSYFQLVHSSTLGWVALASGAVHFTKKFLKAVICGKRNKWKEEITVGILIFKVKMS